MADSGSPIFNERVLSFRSTCLRVALEADSVNYRLTEDTSRFGVWFIETTGYTFDGRSASFSIFFQPLSQPEQADASVRSCSGCSY